MSASDAAQQAIDASCSEPSGSPSSQAPETIATIGTMITDSPATFAGSRDEDACSAQRAPKVTWNPARANPFFSK